jgi:hypothetical protein
VKEEYPIHKTLKQQKQINPKENKRTINPKINKEPLIPLRWL